MKPKTSHFAIAALVAGSIYALAAVALPGNAITVEVYTSGGTVVGERVLADPCHTGMTSWGALVGTRKRVYIPCDNGSGF